MKFEKIAVCASCSEVMDINAKACPSCGDHASYVPDAILRAKVGVDEVTRLLDSVSAVRAAK